MSHTNLRYPIVRFAAVLALGALVALASGCSSKSGSAPAPNTQAPAEQPAPQQAAPEPEYSKWIFYINDDQSFTKGGVTYSIALNLKATNPTGDIAGTYKGSATAKTDSVGTVGGAQLNASAIANSTMLQFELQDATKGTDLAQLTPDNPLYMGTGTIAMKAAGSGTIGRAGGPFGNSSGQSIKVTAQGSEATLSVVLDGHKYTFKGTIRGE